MSTAVKEFFGKGYAPSSPAIRVIHNEFNYEYLRGLQPDSYTQEEIAFGESYLAFLSYIEHNVFYHDETDNIAKRLYDKLLNLPEETTLNEAALYVMRYIYKLRPYAIAD